MGKYSEDSEWADVEPIPLDEGCLEPLAAIAFSDDYIEATSYLRAVMAKEELSERVLALTADVISMNPSHYTVWLYRAKTLLSLPETHIRKELDFLGPISLRHLKNYQIWQHRQTIVSTLKTWKQDPPFLEEMLTLDTKNHHVWSYRQWLVTHFNLWDDAGEYAAVDKLLEEDVRNNSAWNHRWFLSFGGPNGESALNDPKIVTEEWEWALNLAAKAPQNESAWNYIRALAAKAGGPAKMNHKTVIDRVLPFTWTSENDEKVVKSSYALDVLAGLYAETGQIDEACNALDLLANKYDPIRAGYWTYRKEMAKAQLSTGI